MHNRYLIYEMLGKEIESEVPPLLGGYSISGIAEKVFRNVMDNRIEIQVNQNLYAFQEPTMILEMDGDICFLYGDIESQETDEELFGMIRENSLSQSMNVVISESEKSPIEIVRFKIKK